MTPSWKDREANQEHVTQVTNLPTFQWLNGNPQLGQVHPILGSGGWLFSTDYTPNVGIEMPWDKITVHTKNGQYIAHAAGDLSIAILATRSRWVDTPRTPGGKRGGNFQIAGVVLGAEDAGLVCLNSWVTIAMALSKWKEPQGLLQHFRKLVLARASAITKKKYPDYFFWFQMEPGPRVMVGQEGSQSPVTMPVLALPPALQNLSSSDEEAQEALDGLYVGDQVEELCESLWDTAQAWAKEWAKPKAQAAASTPEDAVSGGEDSGEPGESPKGNGAVSKPATSATPATKEKTLIELSVEKAQVFTAGVQRFKYQEPEIAKALTGLNPIDWFQNYPDATPSYTLARVAMAAGRSGGIGEFLSNVTQLYHDQFPTHQAITEALRKTLAVKILNPEEEPNYWPIVARLAKEMQEAKKA